VGRLGSGPSLAGRIGSGIHVIAFYTANGNYVKRLEPPTTNLAASLLQGVDREGYWSSILQKKIRDSFGSPIQFEPLLQL